MVRDLFYLEDKLLYVSNNITCIQISREMLTSYIIVEIFIYLTNLLDKRKNQ